MDKQAQAEETWQEPEVGSGVAPEAPWRQILHCNMSIYGRHKYNNISWVSLPYRIQSLGKVDFCMIFLPFFLSFFVSWGRRPNLIIEARGWSGNSFIFMVLVLVFH